MAVPQLFEAANNLSARICSFGGEVDFYASPPTCTITVCLTLDKIVSPLAGTFKIATHAFTRIMDADGARTARRAFLHRPFWSR